MYTAGSAADFLCEQYEVDVMFHDMTKKHTCLSIRTFTCCPVVL